MNAIGTTVHAYLNQTHGSKQDEQQPKHGHDDHDELQEAAGLDLHREEAHQTYQNHDDTHDEDGEGSNRRLHCNEREHKHAFTAPKNSHPDVTHTLANRLRGIHVRRSKCFSPCHPPDTAVSAINRPAAIKTAPSGSNVINRDCGKRDNVYGVGGGWGEGSVQKRCQQSRRQRRGCHLPKGLVARVEAMNSARMW